MGFKMADVYQIILLIIVSGLLIAKFMYTGEIDQTILGAILGLLVGIPAVKKEG